MEIIHSFPYPHIYIYWYIYIPYLFINICISIYTFNIALPSCKIYARDNVNIMPRIDILRPFKCFDKERNKFTVPGNYKYKETDSINLLQSSLKSHVL